MSEDFFSRADWRPGKRRRTHPRVHAYGGQKTAPVNLLAMAKLVGLHTNRAKRCTRIAISTGKPCRHVAMKGSNLCLSHGGAGAAKKRRAYVSTLPALKAKARNELARPEE
jgi:hypothetical protein